MPLLRAVLAAQLALVDAQGGACHTDRAASNYRFGGMDALASHDNSGCTYTKSNACVHYELTQPECHFEWYVDDGTTQWPPPAAEKYQGDLSDTFTAPQSTVTIIQGKSQPGGASRSMMDGPRGTGARIDCLTCELFVRHVTIQGQHAIAQPSYAAGGRHYAGGAIYIYQGFATIEHVEFINNDADDEGGAIALYFARTVHVADCTFTGNLVNVDAPSEGAKDGGAIYMDLSQTLIIERTTFNNNIAGIAGALYIQTGSEFEDLILSDCSGTGNYVDNGCATGGEQVDPRCTPLRGKACEDAEDAGCSWDGSRCWAGNAHGGVDESCAEHRCAVFWSGSGDNCLTEPEIVIPHTIDGRTDQWAYVSLGRTVVGPGGTDCTFDPLPALTTYGTCSGHEIPNGDQDGVPGTCEPTCRVGHDVIGETSATCVDQTDISSSSLGLWKGRCGVPTDPDEDLANCQNIHVISHACCDNPGDCDAAIPSRCSDSCAISMQQFWHNCEDLLRQIPGLTVFMAKCLGDEAELPGSGH